MSFTQKLLTANISLANGNFGGGARLPDVLVDLETCERRNDFSRGCRARFLVFAAQAGHFVL